MLIAGCGYVGAALGRSLAAHGIQVFGIRRNANTLPEGIRGIACDLSRSGDISSIPNRFGSLVYCPSVGGKGTLADYRALYVNGFRCLLDHGTFGRVLFVSSTGVYGQRNGEWVDEISETSPCIDSGRAMLEAESVARTNSPAGIAVRFSGIYGPGRTRLVHMLQEGRATCERDRPRYLNQIHRADCVGVLLHLLSISNPACLYISSDMEPASRFDVWSWMAEQGRMQRPEVVDRGGSGIPGDSRGNKRCLNQRLLADGYRFQFPTFREGYADLLTGGGGLRS